MKSTLQSADHSDWIRYSRLARRTAEHEALRSDHNSTSAVDRFHAAKSGQCIGSDPDLSSNHPSKAGISQKIEPSPPPPAHELRQADEKLTKLFQLMSTRNAAVLITALISVFVTAFLVHSSYKSKNAQTDTDKTHALHVTQLRPAENNNSSLSTSSTSLSSEQQKNTEPDMTEDDLFVGTSTPDSSTPAEDQNSSVTDDMLLASTSNNLSVSDNKYLKQTNWINNFRSISTPAELLRFLDQPALLSSTNIEASELVTQFKQPLQIVPDAQYPETNRGTVRTLYVSNTTPTNQDKEKSSPSSYCLWLIEDEMKGYLIDTVALIGQYNNRNQMYLANPQQANHQMNVFVERVAHLPSSHPYNIILNDVNANILLACRSSPSTEVIGYVLANDNPSFNTDLDTSLQWNQILPVRLLLDPYQLSDGSNIAKISRVIELIQYQ